MTLAGRGSGKAMNLLTRAAGLSCRIAAATGPALLKKPAKLLRSFDRLIFFLERLGEIGRDSRSTAAIDDSQAQTAHFPAATTIVHQSAHRAQYFRVRHLGSDAKRCPHAGQAKGR